MDCSSIKRYSNKQRVFFHCLFQLSDPRLHVITALLCPAHSNSKIHPAKTTWRVLSGNWPVQVPSCLCGAGLLRETNHQWGCVEIRGHTALLSPDGAGAPRWHSEGRQCEIPLISCKLFFTGLLIKWGEEERTEAPWSN